MHLLKISFYTYVVYSKRQQVKGIKRLHLHTSMNKIGLCFHTNRYILWMMMLELKRNFYYHMHEYTYIDRHNHHNK